jgi:flagellar motor protein MotB
MKLVGVISTAVLSLTLGAAVPVYAQQEEHAQQEEKHAQQDEKKMQPQKPAQQEEKKAQQEEKKTQQEKPAQQEEKKAQQEEKKPQQEKLTAQHEQQAERAGGDNHRIPDDRFRANFGHEHVFVINRPVIIEGQPRFQYGGYWFGFSQPWPVGWLYTDNVYVDFVDGGYYLYNPFHPGIRIVIIVI